MKKNLFLSVISGVLYALSFAPFDAHHLAWFALIPLLFAASDRASRRPVRDGFIAGLVFGFTFFLSTVYWVVYSMYYYGGVPFGTGIGVLQLMVLYLALYGAVFGAGVALARNAGAFVRFLFIPSLWVFLEWLRGSFTLGFPWVLAGYTQAGDNAFIQVADLVGVLGAGFIVVAVNAGIFIHIQGGARTFATRHLVPTAATFMVIAALIYGDHRIKTIDEWSEGLDKIRVSIAQGNVSQEMKWRPGLEMDTIETYHNLTIKGIAEGAELVVWPETAVPFYLAHDRTFGPAVDRIPVETGAYLLTGSPHYERGKRRGDERFFNSAFLLSPTGEPPLRYDKIHLVPFGEFVPLKNLLTFVEKLTQGVGDFTPGAGTIPLAMDSASLGVLICYESIFPSISSGFVREGATILVNITNDAWFGDTSAPYQHFDMALVRAVEQRIFVVRGANTGISAVIGPTGRVLSRTRLFREALITEDVGIREGGPTFFSRTGWLVPLFTFLVSIITIIYLILKKREEEGNV